MPAVRACGQAARITALIADIELGHHVLQHILDTIPGRPQIDAARDQHHVLTR